MTEGFEGRALPAPEHLAELMAADPESRAWLIRAAVVDEIFANVLIDTCHRMLNHRTPFQRGAAVQVGHALLARRMADPLARLLRHRVHGWVGVDDPTQPGSTLAQSALRFLTEVPGPGHVGTAEAMRSALEEPELRPLAWRAVAASDPDAILPHLHALLLEAPALAGEVATHFALVHTEHCLAAALAASHLPEEPRRAFAAGLEKHLLRIHAVHRWVQCRRVLIGR